MKVMWLVDIFNEDATDINRMMSALKGLGLTSSDTVQATYIAHSGEPELAGSNDAIAKSKKFLAKALAEKRAVDLNVKPVVYDEDSTSIKKIVDRSLIEAKKNNIGFICLQTHGKKGFKDLLLGTFAETFIHESNMSTLILSPICKPAKHLKKILFATDLESGALDGVVEAAKVAHRAGASLCLFHIPQPTYNSDIEETESESAKYRKSVHRKLNLLVVAAQKLGVETESMIDSKWQSAAELILKAADKIHADLIMIQAKTSAMGNLLLGSTSSTLIGAAHVPVFVLRL